MQIKESEKACDVIIELKKVFSSRNWEKASKQYWNAKKSFKVLQKWAHIY